MAVREVAFELECFEWADERLEVAGRWKGVAGRRLNRPVLTVDIEGGRRKHLSALPGGQFGAAEESWRAAFAWPGDPGEITAAELEVGGNVVVDLPLPDRRRRRRKRASPDSGDELLRVEIGALRAQVERLRAELAGRERENMQLRTQLDEQGGEGGAVADVGDATVEIDRLAGEREELNAELGRLAEERDRTRSELSAEVERLHAERDHLLVEHERLRDEGERAQSEVDELRQAFADAAAEAEDVRDRHRAEVAALEDELRAERAAVARLTAQLAAGPELPPPATPSGRRAFARGDTPPGAAAAGAAAAAAAAGGHATRTVLEAYKAAEDSGAEGVSVRDDVAAAGGAAGADDVVAADAAAADDVAAGAGADVAAADDVAAAGAGAGADAAGGAEPTAAADEVAAADAAAAAADDVAADDAAAAGGRTAAEDATGEDLAAAAGTSSAPDVTDVADDDPTADPEAARRAAAAAPPTAPLPPPIVPPVDDTEEASPSFVDAASMPGVLNPPGPLRAGARPTEQPAVEETARSSRIPAWLRAGRGEGAEEDRAGGSSLQALKERFEGLFASNGRAATEEQEVTDTYEPVPGPRRSAAAARARAGATVAARRSPAELWALRVLAALLVAVLLIAFLLILTSIA